VQEGIARDLVRVVNDMRKSAGFDVSDRITLTYSVTGPGDGKDGVESLRGALAGHRDYLKAETLADDMQEASETGEGAYVQEESFGGAKVTLGIKRLEK
jgi:isoleucyl-tRNA synthetase